jgi:hypothetical protein
MVTMIQKNGNISVEERRIKMFRQTRCILYILCVIVFNLPALGRAQDEAQAVDPRADKILRQMSEYLNSLDGFYLHTENSLDTLLDSGQKLQLGRAVDVFVRRPDRLRANVKGDVFDQELYYDGKSITLFGKKVGLYATMEAPSHIEAAMDHAMESFGLVAPLVDLIYRNSYDLLVEDVQSGFYVGLSTVLGVETHHLAFRKDEIDWQIWIENSETPFPKKFIITTKWVTGAPQFTALLTKWDVSPQLGDGLFRFEPPEGAHKIEFLPVEKSATPKQ